MDEKKLQETLHKEVCNPLEKINKTLTPKPKKPKYILMIFWIAVGLLMIFLLKYAYEILI
jgi:hypothetical protein